MTLVSVIFDQTFNYEFVKEKEKVPIIDTIMLQKQTYVFLQSYSHYIK
jgi:hypothetical protein